MIDTQNWSRRTLVAQALGHIDEPTRAVVPPIHIATTYIRDPDNEYRTGFIYGRPDNATIREAEAVIAMLEGAEAGGLPMGRSLAVGGTIGRISLRVVASTLGLLPRNRVFPSLHRLGREFQPPRAYRGAERSSSTNASRAMDF